MINNKLYYNIATIFMLLIIWDSIFCAADAAIKIKFSHPASTGSPIGKGAIELKKEIENKLQKNTKVKVYPNSELGYPYEVLIQVQRGNIEMALIPIDSLIKQNKKLLIFQLPFLFEDIGAVNRFQKSKAGDSLLKIFEKKEYKGLAFWHYGMNQFASSMPISRPTDFRGLKVVGFKSKIMMEEAYKLGAKPIKKSFAEIYVALQRGVIDAYEGTTSFINEYKLYEVTKYLTWSNQTYSGYILVINRNFYKRLSNNDRNILNEIIRKVTINVNGNVVDKMFKDLNEINKKGTKIIQIEKKDRNKWLVAVNPVWEKYGKIIGKDLILEAKGTGGGDDPCPLNECRCDNRKCSSACCK
jgi:C4-dicarboxylate-binding protein DctP